MTFTCYCNHYTVNLDLANADEKEKRLTHEVHSATATPPQILREINIYNPNKIFL